MLPALGDDGFDLAALQIDALDRAALIIVGLRPRHDHVAGRYPGKAAIVADVHLAVGAERGAVRPARNFRDDFLAAIGPDAGQPLPADFNQNHRAVGHHHRAFRKFQIGGENADTGHQKSSRLFRLRADFLIAPRATFSLRLLWQNGSGWPSKGAAAQGSIAGAVQSIQSIEGYALLGRTAARSLALKQ